MSLEIQFVFISSAYRFPESFVTRNMSHRYPNSHHDTLTRINLSIKSGEFVVIVGRNGSGKSTLAKLLCGLLKPSSGQILVDGLPMGDYNIDDIHDAIALLSQEFPMDKSSLPLKEIIAFGSDFVDDNEIDNMVKDSASQAGALEFIASLKQGFDTVLQPVQTISRSWHDIHPLQKLWKDLENPGKISGTSF